MIRNQGIRPFLSQVDDTELCNDTELRDTVSALTSNITELRDTASALTSKGYVTKCFLYYTNNGCISALTRSG